MTFQKKEILYESNFCVLFLFRAAGSMDKQSFFKLGEFEPRDDEGEA